MDAESVSKVVVVGVGTMGPGIAAEFARAECEVTLVDVSQEVLQTAVRSVRDAQRAQLEAGLLTKSEAEAAVTRIRTTLDLARACKDADLLLEAVSEDLELKRMLYKRLDVVCGADTVLASNTSGLSITKIAQATKRPASVAGMHFWNPPHIIPLVEVVRGENTSQATADLLLSLCRRLGKRPILVQRDVPGFVGNRLQFAVMREALHLLEEGVASAEDIDTAMTAGPGLRYGLLGPLRTADLGGLDVFVAICRYLLPKLCSSTETPRVLSSLVEEDHLGAKTGAGFYSYTADQLAGFVRRRDRVLLGFLKTLRETSAGMD